MLEGRKYQCYNYYWNFSQTKVLIILFLHLLKWNFELMPNLFSLWNLNSTLFFVIPTLVFVILANEYSSDFIRYCKEFLNLVQLSSLCLAIPSIFCYVLENKPQVHEVLFESLFSQLLKFPLLFHLASNFMDSHHRHRCCIDLLIRMTLLCQ